MEHQLNQKQTAERLGVTTRTLRRWAADGYGPKPIRISRRKVLYWASDVEAFKRGTK